MIGAKELLYYTDPITRPVLESDVTPGTKAFVVSYGTERKDMNPGDIVNVGRSRIDRGQWFLVDSSGYFFVGHIINRAPENPYNSNRIVFITSGLGALIKSSGRSSDHTKISGNIVGWSDQGQRPITSGVWPESVPAAPWAAELWPALRDSETVVLAKVALAKEKWTQEFRKMEIIREGQRRRWLAELDKLRANGHNFPHPTFHLNVSGYALIRTVAPTKSALTKLQTKLENRGSTIDPNSLHGNPAYISLPVQHLLPLNSTLGGLGEVTPETVLGYIRDKYSDYDLQYMPVTQHPVLAGFQR